MSVFKWFSFVFPIRIMHQANLKMRTSSHAPFTQHIFLSIKCFSSADKTSLLPRKNILLTMKVRLLYRRRYKHPAWIISIRIGLTPLTKHSTAITIRINPIRRIITLFPVSPRIDTKRVDARRMK